MPTVKIVAKDVSNGLAETYHNDYDNLPFWYKVGLGFGSLVNREYVESMPKFLPHTGFVLDDKLYEYTDTGLFGINYTPEIQREFSRCYSTFEVSEEKKEEFTQWLRQQSVQKFKHDAYDKVYNNCIIFTQDACQFFNVSFPWELKDFLEWLKKQPFLVKLIGNRSSSGSSSTSSGARG